MDSKLTQRQGRQGGYVLVAVAALATVLLATGIAYMRWSTDEALQSREATAGMQAYYMAQMGIVEEGFMWLRSLKETDLPSGDITRPGKQVSFGQEHGQYTDVHVYGMTDINQGEFWTEDRRFRISAVGQVRVPILEQGQNSYKDVKRKALLYVQVRNFADYMYLSDCELTTFGDRIKFWTGDTLQGRVHSNSLIAIEGSPVFYGQVSTTECDFWRGPGYNPVFHGPPPQFRAPRVQIPDMADNLRHGAAMQGNFFTMPNKSYRVVLGPQNGVDIFRWNTGTPFDSTDHLTRTITGRMCMFFDGPTDLKSVPTGFCGQLTVGSSNILRIIDNVIYCDILGGPSRQNGGAVGLGSTNILGIVSEVDVKIANTPANGRGDSHNRGNNQMNLDSTSVFIDGAIVALHESFSFEQQNDADSGYVYQDPPGVNHQDDRGTIYLYGSVTQLRRGYVHRSTNVSSGYLKQYRYDVRFGRMKPPCFFHVTDDAGRAMFNVVQWGQGWPDLQDEHDWKKVRYN